MVRWGTPEPQGMKFLATLKDINGKTVSKENVIITVVDEMRTLLKGCHGKFLVENLFKRIKA